MALGTFNALRRDSRYTHTRWKRRKHRDHALPPTLVFCTCAVRITHGKSRLQSDFSITETACDIGALANGLKRAFTVHVAESSGRCK